MLHFNGHLHLRNGVCEKIHKEQNLSKKALNQIFDLNLESLIYISRDPFSTKAANALQLQDKPNACNFGETEKPYLYSILLEVIYLCDGPHLRMH